MQKNLVSNEERLQFINLQLRRRLLECDRAQIETENMDLTRIIAARIGVDVNTSRINVNLDTGEITATVVNGELTSNAEVSRN